MYFPFLYGRRSEFLALRAMLQDHRSLSILVPVIEPVNRKPADLVKCAKEYGEAGSVLAIILNPKKHELKSPDEVAAWRKDIFNVIDEYESLLPAYQCISTTTISQVNSFMARFDKRKVAIVYSSPGLSDSDIGSLAGNAQILYHVVLNGKMSALQQDLLPASGRVDIRDCFNKLARNSDYGDAELFTDRTNNFKRSWVGFGDYVSIGSAFAPGGGQPAAVAIHAIYKHKSGDVWIEHFVSEDTERGVGDTASKFLQAAGKLVDAVKARPVEYGTNFALDTYASYVASSHFPNLGTNKVLQIDHHICLMLDVLNGSL